jgi:hypothetical protein
MLTVQVGTFPGEIKTITVANGSTIGAALTQAGISVSTGQEIRRRGNLANSSDTINEGDLVIVAAKSKGN